MPNYRVTVEAIDNLLPQTQCGECGYAGCTPYAKAIVNQDEKINRCPPGGTETLVKLGTLLEKDVTMMLSAMASAARAPALAVIDEDICIGCTKCIKACPVDAIIGSAKQMHVILENACTGCGLCVAPCPVDCIEMKTIETPNYSKEKAKQRFLNRKKRTQKTKAIQSLDHMRAQSLNAEADLKSAKKAFIQAALKRVKQKSS